MTTQPARFLLVWGDITGVGGTETRMAEVSAELLHRGHAVTSFVRTADSSSKLVELLSASGSSIAQSGSWRALRREWRIARPTVVIAFGLRPSLATRAARAAGARSRLLLMARNGLDFRWRAWMHVADRLTSRWVDCYLTNSWKVREHLVDHGIGPARVQVLTSAVGTAWTTPVTERRTSSPVVAMVGNDRPEKNHLFGVDAFLRSGTEATLRIFTDDGTRIRSDLDARDLTADAAARIEIYEGRKLTPHDLDDVDVLLHPSLSESLPRTILEARARGCFVVASDVGDTALHIDDSEGHVIAGFDVDQYAQALRSALTVPRLLPRPARALRDTSVYVDELLALCESIQRPADG